MLKSIYSIFNSFLLLRQTLNRKRKISLQEDELISAIRQKEAIGAEALYDMYSGSLMAVIVKIVQNQEIAEDLLQEAFIKIWNSFNGYDSSKGRLFTWMVNLCRNLAIDKLRSKDFRNQAKNQDIENNVTFIDERNNTVFKPELLGVKDLVKNLKPEQKLILDLIYFQGYTHVEVSDELEIPLGTVKTRLRMAIIELRKYF